MIVSDIALRKICKRKPDEANMHAIVMPLATPAAGLTLAASVGDWYAAVVQHRRDLKDAALAAGDSAALDAIDHFAGWPA